jgi:MoaA/NifB/PqqE/SkfB family radical SAM enzyme
MTTIWDIRMAAQLAMAFAHSDGPVKMILETTRLCNSHCVTCNMWQQIPGNELDPDDLLRAVKSASRTVRWIALTGGEVTLYRELAYLVRGLAKCCKRLLMINIPLNGINPDRTSSLLDQLLRENKEILFHATLSIDGIGKDQDDLRGRGQWRQSIATWRELQSLRKRHRNLRVSTQMTVSRLNVSKSLEVMNMFSRESDTFIVAMCMENSFYGIENGLALNSDESAVRKRGAEALVVLGGTAAQGAPRFELQETNAEAVRAMVLRYPVSGLGSFLEKLFLLGVIRRLRHSSTRVPCVAGNKVIFISAQGEVRPCPFLDRSMGRLENSNYDLRELLKSPAAVEMRSIARACDKCWNNCVGLPSLIASPLRALRLLTER